MSFRYNRHAIRRIREQQGLGLVQLAKAAKVTDRTLAYIEKGYSDPKATTLAKIATALGVSVEAFFHKKAAA